MISTAGRPREVLSLWMVALVGCGLCGCLLAYDYGDHRLGEDGAGAAGSSASGGGQSCSVDESPAAECQVCLNDHCSMQLEACAGPMTCKPFALCVIDCCEPECFTDCNGLTTSELKDAVNECICNFCEVECNTVIPACP